MGEFAIAFAQGTSLELAEKASRAEAAGFDYVGTGDSQSLFREMYVSLTTMANEVEYVPITPTVTNPITCHAVVTASAFCSL